MGEAEQQRPVALVTGCGRRDGIGAAAARALAQAGNDVVVTDIEPAGAQNAFDDDGEDAGDDGWLGLTSLCEELGSLGTHTLAVTADIADEDGVQKVVEAMLGRFGRVDVVVNNASAPKGPYVNDVADVPVDAWDMVMRINVRSQFLVCQAVIPTMREARYGRIVNVSSQAGKVGVPRQAAYCASKAAVIGLTKSVALDVAREGITVNAVLPGRTMTSRMRSNARRSALTMEDFVVSQGESVPRGKVAHPDEIASAIAFLASPAAAHVTGTTLTVDGGEFPVP